MAVIFCQCKYAEIISPEIQEAIKSWLLQNQTAYTSVDDLCGLAAVRDSRLQEWATGGNLIVIACFERAIRWLFNLAGVQLNEDVQVLNQRMLSSKEIIERLESLRPPSGQSTSISVDDSWIPWFPAIDYSRCSNCRQCLNFCLFGVYEGRTDRVQVVRPANCKTGCPACARVCPSAAIIFAKYTESPFNGDTVDEEKLTQLRSNVDYKKWVAENLQKRLQMRNQLQQRSK